MNPVTLSPHEHRLLLREPHTMSLLPPPPDAYMTRNELLAAIQSWSAAQGYVTTIAQSFPKRGYVYMGCD
jgi:hypothetical protein